MPEIIRTIRIEAPIARVWEVLVDVPRQPEWMHDLSDIRIETPGPIAVGSRAIGTVRMFGLSQSDPIEVTALDAPHRYAIAHLGSFVGSGEFRLRPLDDGRATEVVWHEILRPTPAAFPLVPRLMRLPAVGPVVGALAHVAARVSDPLFTPVFAWVFRADLRRFRDLVEGRAPGTGAVRPAGPR